MEQFKKEIQKNYLLALCINIVAVLFIIAMGTYGVNKIGNDNSSDFIHGIQVGAFLGVEICMLYFIGKYRKALKDTEKLRELYIETTDERKQLITAKSYSASYITLQLSVAVAMIIAGFFSETVFFTLFGVLIFSVCVNIVLNAYFSKKF